MIGWIIALVIVAIIMVIFLRFTKVEEGTAQAIMTFGGLRLIVICWRGYKLDGNGNVVKGANLSILPGGLRFVGIWLINTIYSYTFRWQDYELGEGGVRKLKFHEKRIDYINLKPDNFAIKVDKAELRGILPNKTAPERIPVTAIFLWTAEVFNPELVFFHSPPNWNENATTMLENLFTRWIGGQELDFLISLRDQLVNNNNQPIKLWDEFKNEALFKEFESWGFRTVVDDTIDFGGISLGALELPPEIEEAAEDQRKRELKTKGALAATAGFILGTWSMSYNLTEDQMKVKISDDENLRERFNREVLDLYQRDMAREAGALSDIRVQGAGSGAEQAVYNFAAIISNALNGKQDAQPPKVEEKKEEEKQVKPSQKFWQEKHPMDNIHKKGGKKN
jgi:hypothetical protein